MPSHLSATNNLDPGESLGLFITDLFSLSLSTFCLAIALHLEPLNKKSNFAVENTRQSEGERQFYSIKHVFPAKDTQGFTIVIVTVDPAHFNRADMKTLACRLNKTFSQSSRMKAGLLDDENVARLFLSGNLEMPEFGKAQRGLYYLDRATRKEYIQFSTKRDKPNNEVRIKVKCDT